MCSGLVGDAEVENSSVELRAENSTSQSQLNKCSSKLSTVSIKILLRKIELKRQLAEICCATRKCDPANAKAAANAADAVARFWFEEAMLEAEEKLFELSVSVLSTSSSRVHHFNSRNTTEL